MSGPQQNASEQYSYFSHIQVWPFPARMDLDGWLRNFEGGERDLAARLVQEIVHFSESHCDALFHDSLRRISSMVVRDGVPYTEGQLAWNSFLDRAYVIPVADAQRGAESGFLMTYKARRLGFADNRVLHAETALDRLQSIDSVPLVIVDDVVVTGDKFIKFCERPIALPKGAIGTYGDLLRRRTGMTVLSCIVASAFGIRNIQSKYPMLRISAASTFDETACLAASDCTLFEPTVLNEMRDMIRGASARAGVPTGGEIGPFGYGGHGVLLSMHHNTPDATVPLIWWPHNGWRPLLARK